MNYNSIRFTTPKGYAQYPYLKDPDTKFDSDGVYRVNLAMPESEYLTGLLSKLNRMLEDFMDNDPEVAKARSRGKTVSSVDFWEKDDEGRVVLKFKQKAKIARKDGSKFEVKVPQFDSKGTPISVDIGRDSVIKLNFSVRPYYMPTTKVCGLSLRPVAVQVIELNGVTGGGNAKSYGFENEDGYEAEEAEEAEESAKVQDSDIPFDGDEDTKGVTAGRF